MQRASSQWPYITTYLPQLLAASCYTISVSHVCLGELQKAFSNFLKLCFQESDWPLPNPKTEKVGTCTCRVRGVDYFWCFIETGESQTRTSQIVHIEPAQLSCLRGPASAMAGADAATMAAAIAAAASFRCLGVTKVSPDKRRRAMRAPAATKALESAEARAMAKSAVQKRRWQLRNQKMAATRHSHCQSNHQTIKSLSYKNVRAARLI